MEIPPHFLSLEPPGRQIYSTQRTSADSYSTCLLKNFLSDFNPASCSMVKLLSIGLFYSCNFPTGAGIAYKSLMDELMLDPYFEVKMINIARFSQGARCQKWYKYLSRVFDLIHVGIRFFSLVRFCNILYLYLSPNTSGFWSKDFIIINIAAFLDKKIVLTVHSGAYLNFAINSDSFTSWVCRMTLKRASRIIAISPSLACHFDFVGISSKIITIPNASPSRALEEPCINRCLSMSKSCDPSVGSQQPNRARKISILYLSNYISTKGYLDLIQAISILESKRSGVYQLFMYGKFVDFIPSIDHSFAQHLNIKPSSLDQLRFLISRAFPDNLISINGPVLGEEKNNAFKAADVFVLPTYYPVEGCPISIIEAMSYSLPIVATDWMAIPDLVVDHFNGFYVKPRSPNEIARAIERVCFTGNYEDLSLNSRSLFVQNHRFSEYVNAYKAAFMELVDF